MGFSKRFWFVTSGIALTLFGVGYFAAPKAVEFMDRFIPPKQVVFEIISPSDVEPKSVNAPVIRTRIPKIHIDHKRTIILNVEVTQESAELVSMLIMKLNMDDSVSPIYLMLDSPGGDILYGKRIIGAIQTSEAPVISIISGVCASMCAQIHERTYKRYMLPGTTIMFHPGWSQTEGKLQEIHSFISFVLREYMRMSASVADRAGMPRDDFERLIRDERWLTSEEATALKLNDGIVSL